ncbi:hypothetical protein VINI7043_25442 [Vibrio nigripulchritudo ATCC 27043]|nr:hypothetical protein VINI7043_25442 [Vibrio nigripulchritudo ATCC 27043]
MLGKLAHFAFLLSVFIASSSLCVLIADVSGTEVQFEKLACQILYIFLMLLCNLLFL